MKTETAVPAQAELELTSATPFDSGAALNYRLAGDGLVQIQIFDLLGRPVRQLLNALQPAGPHQVVWDGRNDYGRLLDNGPYIVSLIGAGGALVTARLLP